MHASEREPRCSPENADVTLVLREQIYILVELDTTAHDITNLRFNEWMPGNGQNAPYCLGNTLDLTNI